MNGIPGFEETLEEMKKVMLAKNTDYAGEEDPFANFLMVEKLGICDAETAILVRLSDKFSRLITLTKNGGDNKVADEKIVDTMQDAANYLIIWKCLREAKKK